MGSIIKASLSVFCFIFIEQYQILAVVIIYVFSEYFKNYLQVFIIWKKTKIHPFTKELILLYLLCIPYDLFYSIEFNWKIKDYFVVPIVVCLSFVFVSFNKVKSILNEINAN